MQGHNSFEYLFFLLPLIQRFVSGLEDKRFCPFEDKRNCLIYSNLALSIIQQLFNNSSEFNNLIMFIISTFFVTKQQYYTIYNILRRIVFRTQNV